LIMWRICSDRGHIRPACQTLRPNDFLGTT
jgi:hypothetical protein